MQDIDDAKYRGEAAYLANQYLSQMWLSDRMTVNLTANFGSPPVGRGRSPYTDFVTLLTQRLPNGGDFPPTVDVDPGPIAPPTRRAASQLARHHHDLVEAAGHQRHGTDRLSPVHRARLDRSQLMTTIIAPRLARGQSGAGLIETMVGILIGLLVVLVVYNMLAVAEGYKRMTTGAADAQITGLISQFLSSQDAGNGGNGYTSGFSDLISCDNSAPGVPYTVNNTLKPISVLVTRGALATDSDSFISHQGVSPHVVWPVAVPKRQGRSDCSGQPHHRAVAQRLQYPGQGIDGDAGEPLLGHRDRQRRLRRLRAHSSIELDARPTASARSC